ncbi:MAG: 2-dehydro-3-deoxygalactonokinase [Rhodothermales bacterium]
MNDRIMPDTILSCDWGTTHLRVRRVEVESGRIVDEEVSDAGVKKVFREWERTGGDRRVFFASELRSVAERMEPAGTDRSVLISGMASSSIGMQELPYADLPFRLDGADVRFAELDLSGFDVPVVLLSGVRSGDDVMRGEETELVGLRDVAASRGASDESPPSLFILPGTHSKHVHVHRGAVTSFRTYLTGELFELLTDRSVLAGSVHAAPFDAAAFKRGVGTAASRPLLNALFTVRTNALFDRLEVGANYWYLSGLLVGAELDAIGDTAPDVLDDDGKIVVSAPPEIGRVYRAALDALGLGGRAVHVDATAAVRAAVDGHLTFYRKWKS